MIYAAKVASPLGSLTLASDGDALLGLWLAGQKYYMASLPQPPVWDNAPAIFRAAESWLNRYFAGERPDPRELALAPVGSEFRQAVWRRLLAIPYGEVTTYGAIAREMKKPAQAVGGAVGNNPISLIIPCHRVVGADGGLTGYAGGLDTKEKLLRLEGVALTTEGRVKI